MKTLGIIVNPVAGMGGAIGLKGTDGEETLQKAIALGAKPTAPNRATYFLSFLKPVKSELRLYVGAGMMGEHEAQDVGISYTSIGEPKEATKAEDTKRMASVMVEKGLDLLIFCGGDGTARDIMDAVDTKLPVLGVPTGVKMHSAVFAVSPEGAAKTALSFLFDGLPLRDVEVMDIDEEAFRQGRLSAMLYGYMLVPYEPLYIQGMKEESFVTETELRNQAAIAVYLIEEILEPDIIYVLGPGTTTRTITDLLNEKKSLLGVDLLVNKKIMSLDVNERDILNKIRGRKTKIIVTPIGGQGFIFGRGNQQISQSVIRKVGKDNIIVIATRSKLDKLRTLRVDTGDPEVDQILRGNMKVITDYREERLTTIE